jgi:hypothetical protein
VKDKLVFLLLFGVGGGVLYWMCAPDTWRGRKNWDHNTYNSPPPTSSPGLQKEITSESHVYKQEGGRTVKYKETWYRYK